MFWQLAIIALAALWLVARSYHISKLPVNELVKSLSIEIPRAPKMSIDSITDTTVHLHWDAPMSEPRVAFLIYLNGAQVATLSSSECHICLRKLNPSTRYKVDLIALNSKGYKAKSRPVFIKTKSPELQQHRGVALENPSLLFTALTNNAANPSTVHKLATSLSPDHAGRGLRSRSNTINSTNGADPTISSMMMPSNASASYMPDPRSMDDIEELRYYLESGQEELHSVLNQQTQLLNDFKEQEIILREEREKLRERKRLEDGNRQSMKSEIKMLDDSRRLAQTRNEKQKFLKNTKEKNIEKMEVDLQKWNSKIDEYEQEKIQLENSEDLVHKEFDSDISTKESTVRALQSSISALEEEVKVLFQQKKQREQTKSQASRLLKLIRDNTDKAGSINSEGIKHLDSLRALDKDLANKVQSEVDIDAQLEAQWRAEQQREVNRCTNAKQMFDSLSAYTKKLKNADFNPQNITPPPSAAPVPAVPQFAISDTSNNNSNNASNSNNNIPNTYPMTLPLSSNGTSNFSYNTFGSSPSLNSFQKQPQPAPQSTPASSSQQNPQLSQYSHLWNGLPVSNFRNSSPNNALSLNTNLLTDPAPSDELLSATVGHFLPTDLINDEFPDYLLPRGTSNGDNTPSNDSEAGTGTASNGNQSNIGLSGLGPSYNPDHAFNTDSTTNLSARSVFRGDYGIGAQPRYSLEHTSSPPQSFQNEFLSAHNSPSGTAVDMNSIFSGGNSGNDFISGFNASHNHTSSSSNEQIKESNVHPFSPKRLSNVFSFGSKGKQNGLDDQNGYHNSLPQSNSSKLGQSKFFRKTGTSRSDLEGAPQPYIPFNSAQVGSSVFDSLDVWNSNAPGFSPTNNIHNRNVSLNSDNSNIEKDDKSWSNYHNEYTHHKDHHPHQQQQQSQSHHAVHSNAVDYLVVPSSAHSISSSAVSDSNDLGSSVHLTDTNKSAANTVKSSKSSMDSMNQTQQSPGFLRSSRKLFQFGNNSQTNAASTNNGEKSPVKQHQSLFRGTPPLNKIDTNEDSEIEEYNPQAANGNTPKRLFSRSRKSSNSNMRKQSNSSHENETAVDTTSVQSSSTTNSRSIVRKLSFFSKNNSNSGNHKDIGNIDEQVNEEDI